jgi:phage tail-like protein
MSDVARPTGPPFLRLDARTGWRIEPGAAGIVETDGVLALGEAGRPAIAVTEPHGTFGGRTMPRGLAVSGSGQVFLADPCRREVLAWQAGSPGGGTGLHPFTPLWAARPKPAERPYGLHLPDEPPADPYVLAGPTDVALSPSGDLAVADAGSGRVLVVALPSGRLRRVVTVPGGSPTALAFDSDGHAYVADPAQNTVHRFSPSWHRDASFPHPSVRLSGPQHVALVRQPDTAVAGEVPDGPAGTRAVLAVLERDGHVLLDHRGRIVPTDTVPDLEPGALRRDPDGRLLFQDAARPWLDPADLSAIPLTRDGRHVGTERPVLAVPQRVRLPRSAAFTTKALDGGRPRFPWHRIVFHAEIPASTRLLVRTLCDDSPIETGRLPDVSGDAWSRPITIDHGATPELLVQNPAGRHLWLHVELFGDGRATPRIGGIEVFGPRRSAVRFLPAGYHQEPESLHFLDRFLSYFDTVFAEVTTANRDSAALFDPWAVPEGDALAWLGGWFDLDFLAEWSPAVRRRMVAEAVSSARERGTVRGLKRILQRHTGLTDPMPQVIEHFRLPPGTPPPVGGRPLDPVPAAHGCTIVLPERTVPDESARARIEQLITEHIPAHVRFHLRLVPAGVAVGRQSTVGVDTLLGRRSTGALGEGALGDDLVTAGPPVDGPLVPGILSPHPGVSHDA